MYANCWYELHEVKVTSRVRSKTSPTLWAEKRETFLESEEERTLPTEMGAPKTRGKILQPGAQGCLGSCRWSVPLYLKRQTVLNKNDWCSFHPRCYRSSTQKIPVILLEVQVQGNITKKKKEKKKKDCFASSTYTHFHTSQVKQDNYQWIDALLFDVSVLPWIVHIHTLSKFSSQTG